MWKLLVPMLVLASVLIGAMMLDRAGPRADFVYAEPSDIATLDPHKASWLQDLRMISCLQEGLVRSDPFSADFGVVPAAAESWSISTDKRTWTFRLRAGLKWSDGSPLRASDYVWTYRRGMLPDTASDSLGKFQLIRGAKAFAQWRAGASEAFRKESAGTARPAEALKLWEQTLAQFDALVGLKATDDRTLVIQLERPTPYLLELLAYEAFRPICPPAIDRFRSIDPVSGSVTWSSQWTKPENQVCSGPFVLERWRFKRDVRLKQNEHYWNAAALNIDTIDIPIIQDANAAVLAFNSGSVDWITDVSVAYRAELIARKQRALAGHEAEMASARAQGVDEVEATRRLPANPDLSIQAFPAFGTYFYNFNCAPKLKDGRANPFADERVRRAFSMTIDRENIVTNITRCGERAATRLIPPGSIAGYASPSGLASAPNADAIRTAQQLMVDAGYPGGKGFVTVEILFNKDGGHDLIAQAVKRDWEQHLGVSVILVQKERKTFRADLKGGNFMVTRASWFGDYGDPVTFLDINRTGDGDNDRRFSMKAYDDLLAAAEIETDSTKRMGLLSRAEGVLVEEGLAIAPIYHYVNVYLFDAKRVSGISPHGRQKHYPFLVDILGDGKGAERPLVLRSVGAKGGAP